MTWIFRGGGDRRNFSKTGETTSARPWVPDHLVEHGHELLVRALLIRLAAVYLAGPAAVAPGRGREEADRPSLGSRRRRGRTSSGSSVARVAAAPRPHTLQVVHRSGRGGAAAAPVRPPASRRSDRRRARRRAATSVQKRVPRRVPRLHPEERHRRLVARPWVQSFKESIC